MAINRFRNFGGGSVFACRCCTRKTRYAGQGIGTELCPQCYELAGIDNMLNDEGRKATDAERAECNRYIAEIQAKGGNIENPKKWNDYIFSAK